MPLDKRWRGRPITRVRRQGDRILVRLRNPPGSTRRNTWLLLTEQAYHAGLTCVFRPRTDFTFRQGDHE